MDSKHNQKKFHRSELSTSQQRLWIEWKKNPLSLAYNIDFCYKLHGELKIDKLNEAIRKVLTHSGLTRISFEEVDNQPLQILHQDCIDFPSSYLDLSSQLENKDEIIDLELRNFARPYNLLEDCLYRQLVISVGDGTYILYMMFHHIVLDGYSSNWLIDLITAVYNNDCKITEVPELTPHILDQWSIREQFHISKGKELQNYWDERLEYVNTKTRLLEQRNKSGKFKGRRIYFALDRDTSRDLILVVEKTNSTLFILVTAIINTLLYKFTGQDSISFRYTVSNRTDREKSMLGFFIDMLPLRCDFKKDISFSELVEQIKTNRKKDKPFQNFSTSITNKAFSLHNESPPNIVINQSLSFARNFQLSGARCENVHLVHIDPQCDVLFSFDMREEHLMFEIEYDITKYSEPYMEYISESLQALIQEVINDPEKKVSSYQALTKAQHAELLVLSLGEEVQLTRCHNLYELIQKCCKQHPDRIALIFASEQITYEQLELMVDNCVAALENKIGTKNTLIGICLERSIEQVIATLAVIKSGNSYLPLDPNYPQERLDHILEHSNAGFVVTNSENARRFRSPKITKLDISSIDLKKECKKQRTQEGNICYVFYTSGSTGTPKGIPITHDAVLNRISWIQREYPINENDRVLYKTPYNFDVSVGEYLWPLMYGSTAVIATPGMQKDPVNLAQYIAENKVTICHFIPSMLDVFTKFMQVKQAQSLKRIFVSGEALNFTSIENFKNIFPHTKLTNLYGPTEACIEITYWDYKDQVYSQTPPIGRPIQNSQILILDKELKLVPKGVSGDLYLSGIGLSGGYLNSPDLTTKSFLPNPYSMDKEKYARIFKTGDKARLLMDNDVEYLGRIDEQVKIRGQRVELQEIENAIRGSRVVRACHVLIIDTKPIAFVTLKESEESSITEIKRFIANKLPEFMLPSDYFELKNFPLNPNGKIDKKILAELYSSDSRKIKNANDGVEHTTNTKKIAKIWAEILSLDIDQIDLGSNFFSCGGDSIQMLHMLAKLQNLNINITPTEFLANPRLESLAQKLEQPSSKRVPETSNIQALEYTLTPIQYWFFEFAHEGYNQFNQYCTYTIREDVNLKQLETAFFKVVECHDIFHTHFIRYNTAWSWRKNNKERRQTNDAIFSDKTQDYHHSTQTIIDEINQQIDIKNGILIAAYAWQEGGKNKLTICCSHLVIDAVSWRILIDQLTEFYFNPKLSLTQNYNFLNWNHHLNKYASSELDQLNRTRYYHNLISENTDEKDKLNALPLPLADEPTSYSMKLSLSENAEISINIESAILCCILFSLHKLSDETSILVEHESHGRYDFGVNDIDVANSVGWYTSKFPIRYDCSSESLEFLYHECRAKIKAVAKNGIDFGILKYLSNRQISNLLEDYNPHISYNFLGRTETENEKSELLQADTQISLYKSEKIILPYLIDINCWKSGNEIECHFQTKLSEDWFLSFLKKFERSFKALTSNPRLSSMYIPTPLARDMLLYMHSVSGKNNHYLSQWQLEIRDKVDKTRMRRACMGVVNKYSVLRTKIPATSNNPSKVVLNTRQVSNDIDFIFHDLNGLESAEDKLKGIISDSQKFTPFDSDLIKFVLVKIAPHHYILYFFIHHIVIDGMSVQIIKDEILFNYINDNKYENIVEDNSFQNYASWVCGLEQKKSENYWLKELAGFSPTVFEYRLNSNENQPEKRVDFAFYHNSFTLPEGLLDFIKNNSLTPSSLLNGLVGILINKHLYDSEKTIWGNVISVRPPSIDGVNDIVGPCISTLPMNFDFSKDITVQEYLHQITLKIPKLYEHCAISLGEISRLIGGEKLFNVLFTFQNFRKNNHSQSQLSKNTKFSGFISSHFDLTIIAEIHDNQLVLDLKYNSQKFDHGAIKSLTNKLYQLLENMQLNYSKKLGEIDVLEDWEHSVLDDYNNNSTDYEKTSIAELVHNSLSSAAENVAIIDADGTEYNYLQLCRASGRIAEKIQKLKHRKYIGILMPRSFLQVASILGVFGTDACMVGLDSSFPEDKIAEICHDLGIKHVLTDALSTRLVRGAGVNPICVEDLKIMSSINKETDKLVVEFTHQSCDYGNGLKPECYIAYTSGSTGQPKMVVSSEQSHLNRLLWLRRTYPMRKGEISAYKTKLCFAPSIREIFEPLLQGASLCVISENDIVDVGVLLKKIRDNRISRIFFTPTHLSQIFKAANAGLYLDNIRHLEISGESLDMPLLSKAQEILPNSRIYNRYGATEITSVIYNDITNYSKGNYSKGNYSNSNDKQVPAGRPIQNSKAFVVNTNKQLMPIGCIGQVFLGGDSCANGYYKTDNSNVFTQFDSEHTRFFETGDLGKITSDGTLLVLGRKNRICKIRGFRINLYEIENELNNIKPIKQSVVIYSSNKQSIYAFIQYDAASKSIDIGSISIRSQLAKRLPAYSLPTEIILVDEFPKTPSGKINYQELAQRINHSKSPEFYSAAIEGIDGSVNNEIMETFRELHNKAGQNLVEDFNNINFFQHGMNSLTAQLFASRLSEKLNIDLPVISIYSNPDLLSLASAIKAVKAIDHNKLSNARFGKYITLKKGKKPLILAFPPAGGNPLNYQRLAVDIDNELIAASSYQNYSPTNSVEETARDYVNNICELTNNFNEEIILMGWSLGATIAYEVACRLQEKNVTLRELFLIDPGFNISGISARDDTQVDDYKNIVTIFQSNLEQVKEEDRKILQQTRTSLSEASSMINQYQPKSYNGEIVLLKPAEITEKERNYGLKYNGLDNFVLGNIRVFQVPGNHLTMMTNHSNIIADILNRILDEPN